MALDLGIDSCSNSRVFLNEAWFAEPAYAGADALLVTIIRFSWVPSVFAIILILSFYSYTMLKNAETALEREYRRSERLLDNLLPQKIADRLKNQPDEIIADDLGQVSILFADIVGFTSRASQLRAKEIVNFLNQVFTAFDELIDNLHLTYLNTRDLILNLGIGFKGDDYLIWIGHCSGTWWSICRLIGAPRFD